MTPRNICFILLTLFFIPAHAIAKDNYERWAVYYTDAPLSTDTLEPYNLIVFDSDSHPPLAPLTVKHRILLGYVSLGEAEEYRHYYKEIKSMGLLMGADPEWKDHRVVDVRKPEWTAYVLNTLIPFVLNQGFDGIMLDTIDSVTDVDEKKYQGMHQSAIQLIKAIRAKYPNIQIMLNRGFSILPEVAGDIDMLMAESIYVDWQNGAKKPVILPSETNQYYVDLIERARKISPKLKIYTLDYWNPSDKKGAKRIYDIQRKQGFIPYVSTLNLQAIYPEPK